MGRGERERESRKWPKLAGISLKEYRDEGGREREDATTTVLAFCIARR